MTSSASGRSDLSNRRAMFWANATALALFVLPRILLARLRETGYDEEFTLWASRKTIAALFETLRFDSGPPLHYLLVHGLHATTIGLARSLSIVAAIAALFVAMAAVRSPFEKLVIGALLAVYPLHIVFSAEARAYALCALTVGIAAVALDRWLDDGRRTWLAVAVLAITATAYAHYYGLFLVPLPIALALLFRRDLLRQAVLATFAIALLYLPAVPLLRVQLPNAVPWMVIESDAERVALASGTFVRVGFDGRQLLTNDFATTTLRIVSIGLLLAALYGTVRVRRARRYLVVLLVPMLAAIAGAAFGLRAYFPLKFEVILSVPFVLWFFFATSEWRRLRVALVSAALVMGVVASSAAFLQRGRTFESMHVVTQAIAANAAPETHVAATGPAFVALSLARATTPFPAAHAIHPSIEIPRARLELEAARLPVPLVWVGDTTTTAFDVLRSRYALEVVVRHDAEAAVIVRAKPTV